MAPDDVETSDNVRQFVESTLSGDEKASTGALHPLATLGRWLLRKGNTTHETESGGGKGAPPGVFARSFGGCAGRCALFSRRRWTSCFGSS